MITTTTLAAPTVLGLDLSLSSTGLAGNAGGGWTARIKPPANLTGHERIAYIKAKIFDDYLNDIDFVVVEGPSYGSQAGQKGHHERAGLWWLVTHTLWTCNVSVLVMPPASLKKYATGKGNAGKDLVLTEVVRRFAWFNGDNNEADALVLAAAGADWTGSPLVTMPATHRAALVALSWPSLEATPMTSDAMTDMPAMDDLGRPCTIYVPPEACSDPMRCRVHRGAYPADPRTPTHTTSDDVYQRTLRVFKTTYGGIQCTEGPWLDAWRAAVDAARADGEHAATARIVAGLRDYTKREWWHYRDYRDRLDHVADMIERGEFDDVAASND